jgi:hypothetical protein
VKLDEDIAGSPAESDALLDGLAGRGAAGATGHDGARLRAALGPTGSSPQRAAPAWKVIVAATRLDATSLDAPSRIEVPAANHWRWQRVAAGGTAVLALIVGAGLWPLLRQEHGADGMRGTPSAAGAVWRTEQPVQAADALAVRLQHAGATVTQVPIDSGALIHVESNPASTSEVNEVLAPLQASVDSRGRLDIRVLAPR